MAESWAPLPSSTAISSGLVVSVSEMFSCNKQFQIRNHEYTDQRDPYKTRHNSLKLCICPVFVLPYICTLYRYGAADTGDLEGRSQNIRTEWQSLAWLMRETSAPLPSSTAISSGLVESVSWMFPCNDQSQIRNLEDIHMYTSYLVQ